MKVGFILKTNLNILAKLFYSMQGYKVEDGYDFSTAVHPQEKLMWEMAKISLRFWEARGLK